ncbi:MAG: UrcA family protein [Alphaproteobacteria bacterium]|nr:UrcA family protein [Alphaproteobacteria bacterium]MBL6937775.1 UrcA family protein [Alphaproteobacteria bacterium]MBL7099399.1 UrcA family protein [Alphaproteobacteria bacterium]
MSAQIISARNVLLAAAAVGLTLGLTVPTWAQDYRTATYGPTEEVIVTAPRPPQGRSSIGAPIVDVALSGEVRYDDLDLSTGYGARVLERRVSRAARDLCARLNVRYPVATSDSPPCYETAFEGAMDQADRAIARARGED